MDTTGGMDARDATRHRQTIRMKAWAGRTVAPTDTLLLLGPEAYAFVADSAGQAVVRESPLVLPDDGRQIDIRRRLSNEEPATTVDS